MDKPSVDEIINYLSTKFNKIFCDREFVSCVLQDFQVILCDKNKCCVLVFPALEPLYQKAVRYQAKIFDLAVFTVTCGKFRSVAVCHKYHLLKKSQEQESNETMCDNSKSETSISRRKRPERQLYVPPAQRRSLTHNQESAKESTVKLNKSKNKPSSSTSETKPHSHSVQCDIKNQKCNNRHSKPESSQESIFNHTCEENSVNKIYFSDIIYVFENRYITKSMYKLIDISYSEFNVQLYDDSELRLANCHHSWRILDKLKAVSNYGKIISKSEINVCVPLYKRTDTAACLYVLKTYFVYWQPSVLYHFTSDVTFSDSACRTFPSFDFSIQEDCLMDYRESKVPVFPSDGIKESSYKDVMESYNHFNVDNTILRISCDYNIPSLETFLLECTCVKEEKEEINACYAFKESIGGKNKLLMTDQVHVNEDMKIEETKNVDKEVVKEQVIVLPDSTVAERNRTNPEQNYQHCNKEALKNKFNCPTEVSSDSIKKISKKNELEEEKEIMRKTKENINRKTRPIMKYVDDSNDWLKIDKNVDNINNWEDLFDEEGQLQCDLLIDIAQKVGDEVTIVTAIEDYSAYGTKPLENLEHVVELYGFPASFETHDIIQTFSYIKSDAMYVKWVDDTHALLVLGSLTQAQRALEHNNPLIKVRPMTAASSIALEVANRSDLKPAMKRPETNLQTARRLITTHLGAKSRVSREQSAKEKEILKTARELKKLARQNEKDAWEGNLRSTIKN